MQQIVQKAKILPVWGMVGLGALATIGIGMFVFSRVQTAPPAPTPSPESRPVLPVNVTALGRLEPRGEVINLAAPTTGSRIAQLMVQQGQQVQTGQVVAVLDTQNRLQASLRQAQEQVKVAKAKLTQVQAGAKQSEIAAESATVARLTAELSNAQAEYRRYQDLYTQGAISASLMDSKRLAVETAQAQLMQARQTRQSVALVRPQDVQVAQAEVADAEAAVAKAQADLDLAYIRAPRAGQVIKIYAWPGEVVGNDGILTLGQTSDMYAVAQVYESDFKRVRLGQSATLTSDAFAGSLQGKVVELGLQIFKQDVLDTDPTAAADARVVEVKIRLDPASSRQVANLTNLEVTVQIETGK
jgi:HlyD family secretion protein